MYEKKIGILSCLILLILSLVVKAQEENYSLDFSTYIGGSNWEHARDVIADGNGDIIIVGGTASHDFPTTPGAYDTSFNGGGAFSSEECDGFVVKFDSTGKLLWSTFLGGPNYDRIYAVEVDDDGYLYVCGRGGREFPTTENSFQPEFNGYNSGGYGGWQNTFVAKLKPDGSDIVWSSYAGVSAVGRDLDIDKDGNIYLNAGHPGMGVDPPAEWYANAYQKTYKGGADCGVMKIKNDGSEVIWATLLGGSGGESDAASVRVDDNGSVYFAFNTHSKDLPVAGEGFDSTYNGNADYYVAKLSPDGSQLVFGTYLGGSANEWLSTHNLAIDDEGNAYIPTSAGSNDFPTTPGAFQTTKSGGSNDIAVTKLSPMGKLIACTYIGGNGDENADGVYIDSEGNVFVSGETTSSNFPITNNAYQKELKGSHDAVLIRLSSDFSTVLYATYMGGESYESGRSGYLGKDGNLYLTGSSDGPGWPVKNAFQEEFAGGGATWGAGDLILAKFVPDKSNSINEYRSNNLDVQAFPNPFSESITIEFEITETDFVTIKVYNLLGGHVSTLLNTLLDAGKHKVLFDGTKFPGGFFYYKIISGTSVKTGKCLLMK